ncbi:aldehyde dehydrogenase (NAD+) [Chitinophaga costaii]|uniref:Aldehyde dehydrogenase n=1 Tax=Chitinophaga costaii TaxID=1335309 RepID=A0A1C4DXA3_9BACT|nr:aldehyde dehydrogenase [Chitinophaga costaii]PUZ27851.1 aldehyde dehydrogenase [Chitinophaga costaii]SCC36036.1 aldehyde dehydrogenase (NAD+) [Chitinophaga costaii]
MENTIPIATRYTRQQAYFDSGATLSYRFRRNQLKRLAQAIKNREAALLEALHKDLHKSPLEGFTSDIGVVYQEIKHVREYLRRWMKPEAVPSPFMFYPSYSKIYKVPLGLTLIIGSWNYPILLLLSPLIGAMAGGNCAILKPSELAPHCAAVLEALITDTFDPAYIDVVQGEGEEVVPALLQHRFNHIFFTGSAPVGRLVMTMAAKHPTPVTLELGGKSPCLVDETADITVAARRIVWGKYWNAGQTCVAPDYVLVHEKVKDKLVASLKKYIVQFYGNDPSQSPDLARLVNEKRFNALLPYLEQAPILHGGQTDRATLFIAPTLLDSPPLTATVMQEEIFGPILPILSYNTLEEAIGIIAHNPYPLAMYIFTSKTRRELELIERVRFGGGCVNNTIIHFANTDLPVGGVGPSGIGRYHGQYSFETFTHRKSIIKTGTWLDVPVKYPPFKSKLRWVKKFF